MFNEERKFTVFISATEYKHLCSWVLKFEHLETGGDLFGLWLDKHTAVMQLVLGPGKGCRRTGTSFYQDVQYLGDAGSYLTHKEGLCHIGEWHSHHKLGLTRPSGGDENTVWSNMPNYGLFRFVLFIATIGKDNAVNVGCFLFETDPQMKRQHPVLRGDFHLLPDHSPFRSKVEISQVIREKAESLNTDVHLLEIEQSKKDYLVSKPRRLAEQAKQKRIRSSPMDEEQTGEEPQPKRTPKGYRRLCNEEDRRSGDSQSVPSNQIRFTEEHPQQHPFSPDNDEDTDSKKGGCHVLKVDAPSRKAEKSHDEVEREEKDQRNDHDSSQASAPESRKGNTPVRSEKSHRKDKSGNSRGAGHIDAPVVQTLPRVAESHNSADTATVTEEPGTPSGTVRLNIQDVKPEDTQARKTPTCFGSMTCFPWSKKKAK